MLLKKKIFKKVLIFKLKKYIDKRGNLFEIYNEGKLKKFFKKKFVIDVFATSKKNVIRGLHYQSKYQQDKIVFVIEGKILDIIVDIRKKSKTYLKYKKIILSDKNLKFLFIPKGFAHGYCVLSKKAIVGYKLANFYKKKYEKTILWNDNRLKINWPKKIVKKKILSKKDSEK